jgi:hypothetical protein
VCPLVNGQEGRACLSATLSCRPRSGAYRGRTCTGATTATVPGADLTSLHCTASANPAARSLPLRRGRPSRRSSFRRKRHFHRASYGPQQNPRPAPPSSATRAPTTRVIRAGSKRFFFFSFRARPLPDDDDVAVVGHRRPPGIHSDSNVSKNPPAIREWPSRFVESRAK